jgi:hypothetical protein
MPAVVSGTEQFARRDATNFSGEVVGESGVLC